MRFENRLAIGTAAALSLVSAPAMAQLAGGPVVPANPGGFSHEISLGIAQTDLSPYSVGQVSLFAGPVISPFLTDNNSNHFAVVPSGAMSWGLPSGLFGVPAEIWGRFSYKNTDNSAAVTVGGGATSTIPYIDGLARSALPAGLTFTFMDVGQVVSVQRSQTSYDTEAGARVHFAMGGVTISPAAFFGYQRIDQVDALSSTVTVPSDVTGMSIKTNLSTDYYRFGLGLGATVPVTGIGPGVSWFNYLSGSADVVDSRFNAAQAVGFGFTIPPQPGPSFASATASGHHSDVAGHVAFQTGLVNQSSPVFAQFIAVTVGYISDVPFVSYPQFASGIRTNGGAMNHAAQLSSTGQASYGITAGFNFRF
jgi:hypothetical protein